MPPPPAPQWLDWAWPIVILRSRFATSLCSHTGVPREDTPMNVYISSFCGSFWKNAMPMRSMRARLSLPIFCSVSDSDIGKTLPFAHTTHGVLDAGGLERVEDGGEDARLRRRPELVVDHDRDARRALQQLAEARPGVRVLERVHGGRGGVGHGLGLVGPDLGQQVGLGDVELERVPVHELVVLGRADRERVDRLVRNHGAMHLRHPWGSSSLD